MIHALMALDNFPAHIMELEGRKGLVDTGKSSGTWIVPTVSLGLAVLNVF